MSRAHADLLQLLAEGSGTFREYLTVEILLGQAAAEAVGLNATDFFGLNVLALAGSLTAGELAERTGLTTGAATRLIDRLEAAGFVRRVHDPADRRRVIVEPLPDRTDEIDEVLEPARRRMAEVFLRYSVEEVRTLLDYFSAVTPVMRAAMEEMRTLNRDQRQRRRRIATGKAGREGS